LSVNFKDLTGQIFGKLTVIERAENYISPKGQTLTQWLCQCDCNGENNLKIISNSNLKSGRVKSCGCLPKPIIDLIGQQFGRLTVIKRVKQDKWRDSIWLCECNCGNKKEVTGVHLKSGRTQSCGCLQTEVRKQKKKDNTYDLSGDYGIGYTTNTNEPFYFDLEDYDLIKDYCWSKNSKGYIETRVDGKLIRIHRLVTNCPDDMEVDHEFHDEWDNRKEFLRIVTHSQNEMNRVLQSNNTSGVAGVCWDKRYENWSAYIGKNNKKINLGYFDNFEDAVEVRKQAEIEHFGEYRYKTII